MEHTYTQTNYSFNNPVVFVTRGEIIFYLIVAMVLGYLIHYTFSRRRDYIRTPKKKPSFFYNDTLNAAYYPNSEPIYPETIVHHYDISEGEQNYHHKDEHHDNQNHYELYTIQEDRHEPQTFHVSEFQNHESKKDDLKIIEGIGPKIEEILNKAGIMTWHQLSKSKPKELKSILEKAGKQFLMHDPTTWPQQAHLAETKQWGALTELQNYLTGGREK